MITHPSSPLQGVFAAAVTPLRPDLSVDSDGLPLLLDFLAGRGCHGALLFGTTGEGPSFSPNQRQAILRAATAIRQVQPGFQLLAGTGTPSLDETIQLTRAAFDLGFDGVVVLPPYYFRKANDDGLFDWFSRVIAAAVPADSALLAYHIPAMSGVSISLDLLARLKDAHPRQFVGMKDSSGDLARAQALSARFGTDLRIFNGSDPLLAAALELGAAGCITALANICSPDLRRVWDAFQAGKRDPQAQSRLESCRMIMNQQPSAPPAIKAILHQRYGLPAWAVCPPLEAAAPEVRASLLAELQFGEA